MDSTRTEALIGSKAMAELRSASVLICGIGGVGSYTAEAVARAGVGSIILVDSDVVELSNCNRQIPALHSTVGKSKSAVMGSRIKDINPDAEVTVIETFLDAENADEILSIKPDFVADAIDSIDAKTALIITCKDLGIPIISSMGAGNRLYGEEFSVTDIYKTSYDPIARILRKRLRTAGIKDLSVVCSKEKPLKSACTENGRTIPASISYVPAICGLLMAGYILRKLSGVS